jgi:hypothetical protein
MTAAADRRRALLVEAVVEAARGVMAQVLVRERRIGALADMTSEEIDAWQTMRDALWMERASRGAP